MIRRSGLLLIALVALELVARSSSSAATDPVMLQARGQTMGTSYIAKVFNPPAGFPEDWKQQIDLELRRVNDQMSTYVESSEISRFNASDSTQWFDVSPATAMVVATSLEIYERSQGGFDITVAPLVNLWSFGPGKRTATPPDSDTIGQAMQRIGSDKLSVRLEPPAIRKADGAITIDLSAIAKGHGVDRIVELLQRLGARDTFVEIGGEVRATGDKAGSPWKVGLQQPDVAGEVVAIAHPLRDEAVATSGDYRNYFEYQGQRYSHTIDPRTGHPVTHSLASVSVFAPDCMRADAWATAINVLGPEAGLRVASEQQIDSLLMIRDRSGVITSVGTGALAAVASAPPVGPQGATSSAAPVGGKATMQNWLMIALIAAVAFAVAIGAMAIGVLFGRRSISGSCGGLANRRNADGEVSCSLCSNPENACRELRERMQTK